MADQLGTALAALERAFADVITAADQGPATIGNLRSLGALGLDLQSDLVTRAAAARSRMAHRYIAEQHISQAELGRQLGISGPVIHRMLTRHPA